MKVTYLDVKAQLADGTSVIIEMQVLNMEQWLFFLKNAKALTAIAEEMSDIPAFRQAFEFANQANLSPEELEDLERRQNLTVLPRRP